MTSHASEASQVKNLETLYAQISHPIYGIFPGLADLKNIYIYISIYIYIIFYIGSWHMGFQIWKTMERN